MNVRKQIAFWSDEFLEIWCWAESRIPEVKTVELLLQHRADPEARTKGLHSPLMMVRKEPETLNALTLSENHDFLLFQAAFKGLVFHGISRGPSWVGTSHPTTRPDVGFACICLLKAFQNWCPGKVCWHQSPLWDGLHQLLRIGKASLQWKMSCIQLWLLRRANNTYLVGFNKLSRDMLQSPM